jgi:hypothetical protein
MKRGAQARKSGEAVLASFRCAPVESVLRYLHGPRAPEELAVFVYLGEDRVPGR